MRASEPASERRDESVCAFQSLWLRAAEPPASDEPRRGSGRLASRGKKWAGRGRAGESRQESGRRGEETAKHHAPRLHTFVRAALAATTANEPHHYRKPFLSPGSSPRTRRRSSTHSTSLVVFSSSSTFISLHFHLSGHRRRRRRFYFDEGHCARTSHRLIDASPFQPPPAATTPSPAPAHPSPPSLPIPDPPAAPRRCSVDNPPCGCSRPPSDSHRPPKHTDTTIIFTSFPFPPAIAAAPPPAIVLLSVPPSHHATITPHPHTRPPPFVPLGQKERRLREDQVSRAWTRRRKTPWRSYKQRE